MIYNLYYNFLVQGASRGSLDCYFFPLTSTECISEAMKLFKTRETFTQGDEKTLDSVFHSKNRLVFFERSAWAMFYRMHKFPAQ
jgi:hypothetical protein